MTVALRPRLHHLLAEAGESRTLAQIEAMGQDPGAGAAGPGGSVSISLALAPGASTRLLAGGLLDYVLRLDPLVAEVRLEGFEPAIYEDLAERIPFEVVELPPTQGPADFSLALGTGGGDPDLRLDGGGWVASLGSSLDFEEEAILNPIGPLAAACLGTAEVFKALFATRYPDAPATARLGQATGRFCFYDYSLGGVGPALAELRIDAWLLGLGGVGAGFLRALAVLGAGLRGPLRLIDHDRLELHNLNRVTYATVAQAAAGERKALSALAYMKSACPNLDLTPYCEDLEALKRRLGPRRAERRYEVLVTALDDDEVRHSAQRELPRVLIDGSTGRDLNARVERVLLGRWGCLGCTRQAPPPTREEADGCGSFVDPRAPSVSFLAALPGILAAGELLKEAGGDAGAGLRGEFQHVFLGAPNPDLRSESEQRANCRCRCFDPAILRAYEEKYAQST